jgi:hypothetical protein
MAMFEKLMFVFMGFIPLMVVVTMCMVGCNRNHSVEANAYKDGCIHGITLVVTQLGGDPIVEKIDAHCAEAAITYAESLKK